MNPQETVAVILDALIEHGVTLGPLSLSVYDGEDDYEDCFGGALIMFPSTGWTPSCVDELTNAERYLVDKYPELRHPRQPSWILVPENCVELLRNHLALCSE